MILISLALIGVGFADLIRWSPERVTPARSLVAVGGGAALTIAIAALAGLSPPQVVAVGVGAIVALGPWVAFDYTPGTHRPGLPLAWIAAVLTFLFALSGLIDPVEGPLGRWYRDLGFGFVEDVSVDQFTLGLGSGLFLIASANRIVRLVLDASVARWEGSETVLAGGRILGPLERLVIAAIVLAGDPAAGAIVVAAKGLLRFPEIRGNRGEDARAPATGNERGPDAVTEYFLIGTFTSLVLAAALAVLVLASS